MTFPEILTLSAFVVFASLARDFSRSRERRQRSQVIAHRNCLTIAELYELSGASAKVAMDSWKEAWLFVADLLHVDPSKLRPDDTILSLYFTALHGLATDIGVLEDEVIANGLEASETVNTIGDAILVIARRIESEKRGGQSRSG